MSALQNCLEKFKVCYHADELPSDNLIEEFSRLMRSYKRFSDDKILKEMKSECKIFKRTDQRKDKGDYMWLTVNPKPEVSLEDLKKATEKASNSYVFDCGNYVFEQRSEEKEWSGFHMHMIAKRNKSPSVVKSEMKRYFLKLVGNENALHITFVDDEVAADKLTYIKGKKKEEKMKKVLFDQLFRQHYNLKDLYDFRAGPITC